MPTVCPRFVSPPMPIIQLCRPNPIFKHSSLRQERKTPCVAVSFCFGYPALHADLRGLWGFRGCVVGDRTTTTTHPRQEPQRSPRFTIYRSPEIHHHFSMPLTPSYPLAAFQVSRSWDPPPFLCAPNNKRYPLSAFQISSSSDQPFLCTPDNQRFPLSASRI